MNAGVKIIGETGGLLGLSEVVGGGLFPSATERNIKWLVLLLRKRKNVLNEQIVWTGQWTFVREEIYLPMFRVAYFEMNLDCSTDLDLDECSEIIQRHGIGNRKTLIGEDLNLGGRKIGLACDVLTNVAASGLIRLERVCTWGK